MELREPPYPEYREQGSLATRNYRVVFWNHQVPPEGHSAEQMGWAELTIDVVDAEDVHEVIAWAEAYLVDFAEEFPGTEHTYCLYAMVLPEARMTHSGGGQFEMLHLAGADPTVDPTHSAFRRSHPFEPRSSASPG
jgi:hypothetical protein